MVALRLFYVCVLRSRCPCCEEGAIFESRLRCRSHCAVCGLEFDQWVGEWITPTYLASSVGMLAGFAAMAVMLATGVGLAGPVPPELGVAALGCAVALAALRPSKTGWLAVLYWMGGVEVSARARAYLRWLGDSGAPRSRERIREADRRARPAGAPRVQRR